MLPISRSLNEVGVSKGEYSLMEGWMREGRKGRKGESGKEGLVGLYFDGRVKMKGRDNL